MKLHLPVRLFRAIIALMVAVPVFTFSPAFAVPAVTIPDGYEEPIEVNESVDVTYLSSDKKNYAFLLTDDIICDNESVRFVTTDSGSRFFTSADADNRKSISISNNKYGAFRVYNGRSLTLAGLDIIEIKYDETSTTSG